MTTVRTLVGSAARGKRFWRTTTAEFDLSDSERELLAECCRMLDTLDELQQSITELGPTVTGSTGQLVLNPAISEASGQRALLHRLLSAMALPNDEGQVIPAAVSQRGNAAAQAKWHGQRRGP